MKEALRDADSQAYILIPMRGWLMIENMINNYQFHNKLFFNLLTVGFIEILVIQ